ncbi:hypothetical protein Bbelb_429930 [Branchiostoma belcheri]|nr:hypothetical protein Bbelb_429930 [Branchiostoma belcheri]
MVDGRNHHYLKQSGTEIELANKRQQSNFPWVFSRSPRRAETSLTFQPTSIYSPMVPCLNYLVWNKQQHNLHTIQRYAAAVRSHLLSPEGGYSRCLLKCTATGLSLSRAWVRQD